MTADEKLNAATNALKKVLSAVQRHLPPDGISEREAMGEIIEAVDPWPLDETVSAKSKRTAEDKIKEVMELVDQLSWATETAAYLDNDEERDEFIRVNHHRNQTYAELETKLRQLIKDDDHGL